VSLWENELFRDATKQAILSLVDIFGNRSAQFPSGSDSRGIQKDLVQAEKERYSALNEVNAREGYELNPPTPPVYEDWEDEAERLAQYDFYERPKDQETQTLVPEVWHRTTQTKVDRAVRKWAVDMGMNTEENELPFNESPIQTLHEQDNLVYESPEENPTKLRKRPPIAPEGKVFPATASTSSDPVTYRKRPKIAPPMAGAGGPTEEPFTSIVQRSEPSITAKDIIRTEPRGRKIKQETVEHVEQHLLEQFENDSPLTSFKYRQLQQLASYFKIDKASTKSKEELISDLDFIRAERYPEAPIMMSPVAKKKAK
jgi:hypothetical protein